MRWPRTFRPISAVHREKDAEMVGMGRVHAYICSKDIMLFGWNRVRPLVHFFATCMVALGASLIGLLDHGGQFLDGVINTGRYLATLCSQVLSFHL